MKVFATEEPSYRLPDVRAEAGGSYNLWWVYLGSLGLASSYGPVPAWLVGCLTLCLSAAIVLDRAPFSKKISFSALPYQVFAYLALAARLLIEMSPLLLIAFVVYLMVRPALLFLHAWGGNSFWPLFAFFFIAQTVLFIRYVFGVVFRWNDPSLWSFESNARKANLRTRKGALRHLAWSLALALVGNSARAGTQLAVFSLFETIIAAFGIEKHVLDPLSRPFLIFIVVSGFVVWLLLAGRAFQGTEYF